MEMYLNQITSIYLILILLLINIYLIYIKYYNQKNFEKTLDKILIYIDQYYITNFWYTLASCILYIFCNSILIIYLRFILLEKSKTIQYPLKINPEDIILGPLIYKIFIFLFLLLLIKILLDLLFFKEIIKLHIYLINKTIYNSFITYFNKHYLIDFWGKFYLFFYNISLYNFTSNHADLKNYLLIYEYDNIYENKFIYKLSVILVTLNRKFFFINFIFKSLVLIFKWLYDHIRFNNGFASYIPYIIFFIAIFYNFLYLNIENMFYSFVFLYVIGLFMRIIHFINKKNLIIDQGLAEYFYANKTPYKEQRVFFRNIFYLEIHMQNIYNTKENCFIFNIIKDGSLITYIFNNFNDNVISEKPSLILKHINAKYKRWFIISLITMPMAYCVFYNYDLYCINLIIFNIKISPLYILILTYMLMFMCSYKALNITDKNNILYKKYYVIFFWFFVIIQIYFFWIIFIKCHIFL